MGAASGLVAAPCGAPAFAAVLTFVAATDSAVLGLLYLLVFSLGLTALLVAVGVDKRHSDRAAPAGPMDALGQTSGRASSSLAWRSTTSCKMGGVL